MHSVERRIRLRLKYEITTGTPEERERARAELDRLDRIGGLSLPERCGTWSRLPSESEAADVGTQVRPER